MFTEHKPFDLELPKFGVTAYHEEGIIGGGPSPPMLCGGPHRVTARELSSSIVRYNNTHYCGSYFKSGRAKDDEQAIQGMVQIGGET